MSPIFSKVFSSGFLLYALVAVSALPHNEQNESEVEKKDTDCNADNALRCLRRSSVQATPFCSSYNNVPVVTSTVATTTPTTYGNQTTLTLMSENPLTSISQRSSTTTTITTTSTVTSTLITTTTLTGTIARREPAPTQDCGAELDKRVVNGPPAPACASTYPASRISSACSCLGVTPSTTRVTSTAPVSTSTISTTVTVSVTVMVPLTVTVAATSTTPPPVRPCTLGQPGASCQNDSDCCSYGCGFQNKCL